MKKNSKFKNWMHRVANNIKGFAKELKRVRWPNGKDSSKMFRNTLIFVIISSLGLFIITLAFTNLWSAMGVGI